MSDPAPKVEPTAETDSSPAQEPESEPHIRWIKAKRGDPKNSQVSQVIELEHELEEEEEEEEEEELEDAIVNKANASLEDLEEDLDEEEEEDEELTGGIAYKANVSHEDVEEDFLSYVKKQLEKDVSKQDIEKGINGYKCEKSKKGALKLTFPGKTTSKDYIDSALDKKKINAPGMGPKLKR